MNISSMYIRVFDTSGHIHGVERYLNFLRLESGFNSATWRVETCNPVTWMPPLEEKKDLVPVADLHIYVTTPVRLAVPWSRYNVFFANRDSSPQWAWVSETDLILAVADLTDRKLAIARLRQVLRTAQKKAHPPFLPLPPLAPKAEAEAEAEAEKEAARNLPKIGIITVTRNRVDWWANMIQNVTRQDWPVSKLEWIIVDDGDEGQRLDELVAEFQTRLPQSIVKHVIVPGADVLSIGAKRNLAVQSASADVSIFVCMDDDDHYPAASVKARTAWLRPGPRPKTGCSYCSTIPMYDIRRYISAMSASPLTDGPADRVSEATLAFTRDFWTARPFPDVSTAEGRAFVEGREVETVEIPPMGVIVSFIHNANSSSRRVPANQPPNGCHYGLPDAFFKYLHENFGSDADANTIPDLIV